MTDVYLVGVGGQGIITASRIIGDAALLAGKNVVLSETHGMAQRGGAVACTARIGEARSPLIPDHGADAILSFELLETLRALPKASESTVVISSTEVIPPPSASARKAHYPTLEEVRIRLAESASRFILVDAKSLAVESGAPISSNVVMVGALAGTGVTGIERGYFEKAIASNVRGLVSENLAAFSRGLAASVI